jgi:tripartite-type tricarboxylate transporter receptor subunit TctC
MRLIHSAYALALGVASLVVAPTSALAQNYPSKSVKFVVGFSAGSSIDTVARILANNLNDKFGHPVIVENRPGANGMLAATTVANSEPDGHTVLISNSSTITVNPLLHKKMNYNVEKDFAPVSLVVSVPFILTTSPTNPKMSSVNNLTDLMRLAKSEPGELTYGSAGIGNLTQLTYELLNNAAGVEMLHVPYKGSAAAQVAVLGGQIHSTFDNPAAMPQIKAGKLRAIAVSSAKRWRDLPDVPSIAEQGYPNVDISFWVGVLVPSKTPPENVKALYQAIKEASEDPKTKALLAQQGNILTLDPQAFAQQIKTETSQYAQIIKQSNIQLVE